jgi:hypothetical protein
MEREIIRETAGRMSRSEELKLGSKESAAEFLRAHPAMGNPHVVRCSWCHQTTVLFRDEDLGAFAIAGRGWRCVACNEFAASQEVKF